MILSDKFVWGKDSIVIESKPLLKYSDDQPRDERGRFGSGGGSTADSIAAKAAIFREQGGELSNPIEVFPSGTGLKSERDIFNRMLETMPAEWHDQSGVDFTYAALNDASHGSFTIVAYGENMSAIAGALNYDVNSGYSTMGPPSPGGREKIEIPPQIYVEYLGSTGIVDGTGSALVASVIQEAAGRGIGIGLSPVDKDAADFWSKMGMTEASHPSPVGTRYFQMSADKVKETAAKL